jgi:hypothetical protein
MFRTLLRVAACSFALATTAIAADTYPRLATYSIGSPQDYWTADFQKQLATVQVAILSYYPGWGVGAGVTMNETVRQIKARNPNTKVFLYERPESQKVPMESAFDDVYYKIQSEKWWLYTAGTAGSQVLSDFGNGYYLLNTTTTSRKDASGRTWMQWFAGWVAQNYLAPNPLVDGVYTDNVFSAPRRDGDWNLDGKIESHSDVNVQKAFRLGYVQFATALRSAAPGKLNIANAADWGHSYANIAEYQGQYNGGLFEHMLGRSNSIETYAGWAEMMKAYRKGMAALAAPKLGICSMTGSPTDYQAVRYGLASCSMDDGYFAFSNQSKLYHGVPWFDEYGAKLGSASSGPSTAAWQSGVYRRDFQNGIVLVNPKGNGARTVTLEGDFVKISGTQVPSVNSGQTVRQVTLQDRDGIILMRKSGAATAPEMPANFTVN